MTCNLKTLGLTFAAALVLGAAVASAAAAAPALLTATVAPLEVAQIHGEQVGTDTLAKGITCATVKETGFPDEKETHKKGPSASSFTLAPQYGTCHAMFGFILTRTVTVTVNDCAYTFSLTKDTGSTPFSADLTINCLSGQQIEIHIYNTANHNDFGAAVLCAYDIEHYTLNNKIELTNIDNPPPVPDHILTHFNTTVPAHNTIKSATCGQNDIETFASKGTHTAGEKRSY